MQFKTNKTYNFSLYSSKIQQDNFTMVKVLSIMDWTCAVQDRVDIGAMHANIYPTLPPNVSLEDPTNLEFIKVRKQNGETVVLCTSWIREDTIKEYTKTNVIITVMNASADDISRLTDALASNNYNDIKFSIVDQ